MLDVSLDVVIDNIKTSIYVNKKVNGESKIKSEKKPHISVITTAFNAEKTIAETVESILDQTFRNFEFVIVDDGSDDDTVQTIEKSGDDRIRLLKREHFGRSFSLNYAIQHTRGAYIANIDADDIALPERLEKQFLFLNKHPDVALLGTFAHELNEYTGERKEIILPTEDENLRTALAFYCPFIHSSIMLRRNALKSVGIYNRKLQHSEDFDLWIRIAAKHKIANLAEALVIKRIHPLQSFKGVKEKIRFKIEARLCLKAALTLSLPLSIKIQALIFFIYSNFPFQLRQIFKSLFPGRFIRSAAASRQGWSIK